MILSRYMARRYLVSFLGVLAVMAAIVFLLDIVEQLRRFSGRPMTLADAARLAALRMPSSVHAVLPLVALLAALAMFVQLARSSELVVARAVGRSALWVAAAPAAVALGLGTLAVAAFNPIAAATLQQYEIAVGRMGGGEGATFSISPEGIWLRESVAEGQRLVSAVRVGRNGDTLEELSLLTFDAEARPVELVEAETARLAEGRWELAGAKRWRLTDPNPERSASRHDVLALPTELTGDSLRDRFSAPETISIWALPKFIDTLDRAGFTALRHRVWLQMELAMPAVLMAMVLVAAGFTMGHIRAGRQGMMVLMALLAGFAVFFLRNFTQVLGENGQIPVVLAGWSPPAVAALLALALLLHREES